MALAASYVMGKQSAYTLRKCDAVISTLLALRLVIGCCRPCVAGFVAFFIAQSLKVLTHWYTEAKWDFTQVMRSGGMPSSHTACVSREHSPTSAAVADAYIPQAV